jgi:hypothetical protein
MDDLNTSNYVAWMVRATDSLDMKRQKLAREVLKEFGVQLKPGERASDVLHHLDSLPEHELRGVLARGGKR